MPMRATGMTHQPEENGKPLGVVWIDCPPSLVSTGLVRTLEDKAIVHQVPERPEDLPSCIILCANNNYESLSERVAFYTELSPNSPPVVVFGTQLDLPLARDALEAGASGFVHAEMTPDQLVRAVAVAAEGELVAPRELLRYVLNDHSRHLVALSPRQREILGHVVEGLSNAEIGRRLCLSESTIKQHLRSAYKLLGVSNRTEAANLFRQGE